jgi:hypothetical protein
METIRVYIPRWRLNFPEWEFVPFYPGCDFRVTRRLEMVLREWAQSHCR